MTDQPYKESESDREAECWRSALRYVSNLGAVSYAVAGAGRALLHDDLAQVTRGGEGETEIVLTTSEFPISRLLNSPSVLAHLYYAVQTYQPEKLSKLTVLEPKDLLPIVGPRECANLLFIMYFYRRILTRADQKECEVLTQQLQQYLDVAYILGKALPSLGVQVCMMVAAGRYLGWGALLARDLKMFKKYKVNIRMKRVQYDFKGEFEVWGTTHAHVGATMFQSFGFGVDAVDAYINGVRGTSYSKMTPEEGKYAVAQLWLDALMRTGKAPQANLPREFSIEAEELAAVQAKAQAATQAQEYTGWLFRRRTDLSYEKTPRLVFDFGKIKPTKRTLSNAVDEAEE